MASTPSIPDLLGKYLYTEKPKKKLSKKAIKHLNDEQILLALFKPPPPSPHPPAVDHFTANIRNNYVTINGVDYNYQLQHKHIKKIMLDNTEGGEYKVTMSYEAMKEMQIKCMRYLQSDVDIKLIKTHFVDAKNPVKFSNVRYHRIFLSLTSHIDHGYLNYLQEDPTKKFGGGSFKFTSDSSDTFEWCTIEYPELLYIDQKYTCDIEDMIGDWTQVFIEFQVIKTKSLHSWSNRSLYLNRISGPIGLLVHPNNNELWVKIANGITDYKVKREVVLIKSYRDLSNKLFKKDFFGSVEGVELYQMEAGLIQSDDISLELFMCVVLA